MTTYFKNGGQTESLNGNIKSITVTYSGNAIQTHVGRVFEMRVRDTNENESLSYLTLDEVISFRDELNTELKSSIFDY
jgi:hypothetical protein